MVSFCLCRGFFFCDVISYNIDRRTADMLLLSNDNYQESYQLVIQLERLLHNTAGSKVGCLVSCKRPASAWRQVARLSRAPSSGKWRNWAAGRPCSAPLHKSSLSCAEVRFYVQLYIALLRCLLCSAGCCTCKWLHLLKFYCTCYTCNLLHLLAQICWTLL